MLLLVVSAASDLADEMGGSVVLPVHPIPKGPFVACKAALADKGARIPLEVGRPPPKDLASAACWPGRRNREAPGAYKEPLLAYVDAGSSFKGFGYATGPFATSLSLDPRVNEPSIKGVWPGCEVVDSVARARDPN